MVDWEVGIVIWMLHAIWGGVWVCQRNEGSDCCGKSSGGVSSGLVDFVAAEKWKTYCPGFPSS